ncbi:glutathione-regulated potassium-efflux system [Vibrio ishigakensis]|uniref:Glutathione-regulated potassium-efflux system n=2 Tax=Vibrio ishigakensis TaxID=1481914 RepID=A0A0B8NQB2_9VIBR|nr:glutathione-regulated potassium-efflux system [Vibrio ishigakensis]
MYQAKNKAKLTQVLSQQAEAKAELEEVEMEWMSDQETLESMQAELDAELNL